uniref:PD-(D/E)XK nuclease superfamily protein n=1 Tax=viral metagenome TaxID=1070528 RepID=A0A6H1ZD48_9ZZZZ
MKTPWEIKLPSVTQALGRFVDLQHIPPERLRIATARGSKIHDYIFMDLKELWIPPALITPEIEGYWKSYLIFKREMIEQTVRLEEKLHCTCYGYTGILDWCGILRGEKGLTVIDWKSPVTEGKTWRSQVAAYWHLVECHARPSVDLPITRCGALILSPTGGTPSFREYSKFQPDYFNDFLFALGAYRAFSG